MAIIVIRAVAATMQRSFDIQGKTHGQESIVRVYQPANIGHLAVSACTRGCVPTFACRFFLNAYSEPMPFGRFAELESKNTFLNMEKQDGQDIPVTYPSASSSQSCPSV
jgi:hypothetical protein